MMINDFESTKIKWVIIVDKHTFDFEETNAYSVGELLFCFYVVECLSLVRREIRL